MQKVAILDFDVHHGNGTEACVRNLLPTIKVQKIGAPFLGQSSSVSIPSLRPWLNADDAEHVFFASVHGYDHKKGPGYFYPGTGATEQPHADASSTHGDDDADNSRNNNTSAYAGKKHKAQVYNVGMRKHCREEWRRRWLEDILNPLAKFNPDLVFISAGFDAHCRDKLNHGYIGLIEADYTWLTEQIVRVRNKNYERQDSLGSVVIGVVVSLFVSLTLSVANV